MRSARQEANRICSQARRDKRSGFRSNIMGNHHGVLGRRMADLIYVLKDDSGYAVGDFNWWGKWGSRERRLSRDGGSGGGKKRKDLKYFKR